MAFASYDLTHLEQGMRPVLPILTAYAHDDPERYLAENRWADCVSALSGTASQALADRILTWMKQPPPQTDPAWEPYSCSERVVNLAVLLCVRPEYRAWFDLQQLRAFFADSLQWIDRHLEYYGPRYTNNHILNNARALIVGGAVLQSSDAVERGLVLFSTMARTLFQRDGFLRERSSSYQVIVTNWLCDAAHFSATADVSTAACVEARQEVAELTERVGRATATLLDSMVGQTVHIGDISPDLHPGCAIARLKLLYPGIVERGSVSRSGRMDDWIFAQNEHHSLVLCAAIPFPPAFTTHGHRDLGSFVWFHRRRLVLVDPGRFQYTPDSVSRSQMKSDGHNCLLVEGIGPLAESIFTFAQWLPSGYAEVEGSLEVDPYKSVALRHNGFSRLMGVGDHIRRIQMEGSGLLVEDRIEGSGTVKIDTLWHFAPDLTPVSSDPSEVRGAGIVISVAADGGDGNVPDRQWQSYQYSSEYGRHECAHRLRLGWVLSLPCTIRTTLRVFPCAGSPAN